MEAIIINNNDSALHVDAENAAIRIAYILGFTVKNVSTFWNRIFFEKYFSSYSIKDKWRVLIDLNPDEEDQSKGQEALDNYITLNKVKHKPPQLLMLLKKTEINLLDTFKIWMESILDDENEKTFINLHKIVEPNVFEVFKISFEDEEHEDKSFVSLSKAFLKILPGFEASTNIFFLPPQFFNEYFLKKLHFVSSDDEEAATSASTYFDTCFTFYDLKNFTPEELQVTRTQLAAVSGSFMKNFEEWTGMFTASYSDGERLDFFKEKIKKEANIYSAAIEKNETIQQHPVSGDEDTFSVLIGEMPVSDMYEYYKHWKVIGETAWSKIQAAMHKESYNKRWPVMALKTNQQGAVTPDTKGETFALFNHRKKSIIID